MVWIRVGDHGDAAAVEAIGDHAGDQEQRQHRQKLGEADETEIKRIAGQFVDLPANRDIEHLQGRAVGQAHHREGDETAIANQPA